VPSLTSTGCRITRSSRPCSSCATTRSLRPWSGWSCHPTRSGTAGHWHAARTWSPVTPRRERIFDSILGGTSM